MFTSINRLLRDRISSPLYSTFIISWLVINWKIPFLTFFVSEERIDSNKIDYIVSNYLNWRYGLGLPLASTLILLLIIPFIDYAAFVTHLRFKNMFRKRQYEFDSESRLTIERSRE